MIEKTSQIVIEKANNGFQLYINDYRISGTSRPVPYVFETMENLLKFISETFK